MSRFTRAHLPRSHAPSAAYQPDGFAAAVGSATHRLIADLLNRRDEMSVDQLIDEGWLLAALAVDTPLIGRRHRAARIAVSGHAAVYIRRFMPGLSWQLLGAELDLGDGLRVDLGFESEEGVVFDELKLSDGRTVPRGEGPTSRQVALYADAGARLYAQRFLGVRLLYLAAPNYSLFVRPDGIREPLADTTFALTSSPARLEDAVR